jgi:hypothetical protein
MPAALKARPTRSLIDVLRDACAYAAIHGIPVRIGETGVHCVSSQRPCWTRDAHADGVCPVGAAILRAQPDCTSQPAAAAIALEVHLAVSEGLQDGLNVQPKASVWVNGKRRDLYLYGYEMGVNFRIAILARRCDVHGGYPLEFDACPTCRGEATDELDAAPARGRA